MSDQLTPCRISVGTILSAVSKGWAAYRRCLVPAAGFAGVFMLIGVGIFGALAHFGLSAMMLPFAGGFLLVGPAVLAGFFLLRRMACTRFLPLAPQGLAPMLHVPASAPVLPGQCAAARACANRERLPCVQKSAGAHTGRKQVLSCPCGLARQAACGPTRHSGGICVATAPRQPARSIFQGVVRG